MQSRKHHFYYVFFILEIFIHIYNEILSDPLPIFLQLSPYTFPNMLPFKHHVFLFFFLKPIESN